MCNCIAETIRPEQRDMLRGSVFGEVTGEFEPCWRDDCDGTAVRVKAFNPCGHCGEKFIWLCSRGLDFLPPDGSELGRWSVLALYSR